MCCKKDIILAKKFWEIYTIDYVKIINLNRDDRKAISIETLLNYNYFYSRKNN